MSQLLREIESLIQGRLPAVCIANGGLVADPAPPAVILSGAFNPLHVGHMEMAEAASREATLPVAFELSAINVEKHPLTLPEVNERLTQFGHHTLWLTCAPTFAEKAKLFPGVQFVVGADTILRVADPKYYAHEQALHEAIDSMIAVGCKFLVFGRVHEGNYRTLGQLPLPPELLSICQGFTEAEFRRDISSSDLRGR